MTRIEFFRRVERPATATAFLSTILWVYTFVWGNTLNGLELSIHAFIMGAAIALICSIPIGVHYIDVLPGLTGPGKRLAKFCLAAVLFGGVVAACLALALNRFWPAEAPSARNFVLVSSHKIKGGWSAKFVDGDGNEYEHTFGHVFGPVPKGTSFEFSVQTGCLGYPYFHSYKRLHLGGDRDR